MIRALLITGLIAALGSVAVLIAVANSTDDKNPTLTHAVTRGDLVVTIVEQGTVGKFRERRNQVRGAWTKHGAVGDRKRSDSPAGR